MNEIEARVAARLAEQMAAGWYERTLEVIKERDAARAELAEVERERKAWQAEAVRHKTRTDDAERRGAVAARVAKWLRNRADRIEGDDRG